MVPDDLAERMARTARKLGLPHTSYGVEQACYLWVRFHESNSDTRTSAGADSVVSERFPGENVRSIRSQRRAA